MATHRETEHEYLTKPLPWYRKLNVPSMVAWFVLIGSLSAWAVLGVTQTNEFGANVLTELLGVTAELAAVVIALDWVLTNKARQKYRVVIQASADRVARLALEAYGPIYSAYDRYMLDRFPTEVRMLDEASHTIVRFDAETTIANLRRAASEIDRALDRHRISLTYEPDLLIFIQHVADTCELLADHLYIRPTHAGDERPGWRTTDVANSMLGLIFREIQVLEHRMSRARPLLEKAEMGPAILKTFDGAAAEMEELWTRLTVAERDADNQQ